MRLCIRIRLKNKRLPAISGKQKASRETGLFILSNRLRKLVDAEVLATQAASDGSAYQEYVLTAKGESLFAVVLALRQWGERYLFEPGEPHSLLIDKGSGQPVPLMLPKTQDGAALLPAATEVRKLT